MTGIDNSQHTLGIFLDFSKAFDTLNHDILLYKLNHYGIRGKSQEWFTSYLSNRKQCVSIDSTISTCRTLSCGVPQGSILVGPLLFLIYINDITSSSKLLSYVLFADDSNLFYSHKNIVTLVNIINIELRSVSDWIKSNKLSLNLKKTTCMLFSNKHTVLPIDICIDNMVINLTNSVKFLGLYIDNKLSWKYHIDYLCKIISRNMGIINKLKAFFPHHILFSLYNTLILSYINYGILAWGSAAATTINRLLILQKRALRIVNNSHYFAHTNPFFVKHKSLKINDLYNLQLGSFMFQLVHNELPKCLTSMFTSNKLVHSYSTRQASLFHIPLTRSSLAQRTTKYTGPKLWNSLDNSLRKLNNIKSFKNKLKEILLNKYK